MRSSEWKREEEGRKKRKALTFIPHCKRGKVGPISLVVVAKTKKAKTQMLHCCSHASACLFHISLSSGTISVSFESCGCI